MTVPKLEVVENAKPATAIKITCCLGRVANKAGVAAVDDHDAEHNSSRWIFDVEHDTHLVQRYELQLLAFINGRPLDRSFLTVSIAPLNRGAVEARPRVPEPDLPAIELDDVGKVVRYRVTIDAVRRAGRP